MNDPFNENTCQNVNTSFTKHDSFSSSLRREIPNKRRPSVMRNHQDLSRYY